MYKFEVVPLVVSWNSYKSQKGFRSGADGAGSFRDCGCRLNNAFMQLSLLALVVIPELRISDLGIVDVTKFEVVPLIVS